MKNLSVTFLAIIIFSISIYAQGSSDSELIRDTESGYSFNAPEDWKNQKIDGGYVFTNSSETANIVVKPHNYEDFDSFVKAEVNLEVSGYKLAGQIRDLGNGGKFARVYKPSGNKYTIIDAFFLLSPYQGGVLILTVTNDETTANAVYEVATDMVKSVKYSRPQQSEQSTNIQTAFAGKKLSYFYTGNGYSENRTIWLCPSGTYYSKSESLSSSSIGSGSTYSEDAGTWQVQSNGGSVNLILNSQRGKGQRNFTVTARQASNEIGLNNARYFVETHNQCK